MTENSITINGRQYVALDSLAPGVEPYELDLGVRIVVLQRGWVVVGRVRRVGPRIEVERCAVVRRWGTTAGLGQLAIEGPQANTVLDDCPPVEALESEVVLSMRCAADKWASRA